MAARGKHGFDAARLNRIDAFLKERYLDSGKLPHAQVLISRDGEIRALQQPGRGARGGRPGRSTKARSSASPA